MRVSVPGVPGVYYDTDTKSTALTTAFSVVGRRVPRPQRYALQALPLLWSLDVDLQEVPDDHPFQYLHPEGAHSIEELTRDGMPGPNVGREFERTLQFAMAVNRETERGINELIGRGDDEIEAEGTVIEIRDLNDEDESVGGDDSLDDETVGIDEGSDMMDDISDGDGPDIDDSGGDDGGADGVEDGLDGVEVDPDADDGGPDDEPDRGRC